MNAGQIAAALEEIAVLLELKGENPFKVRAYENGARLLRGLETGLADFVRDAQAGKVKGIGPALAEKITALYETGSLPYLDELRAEFPAGLLELLRIPGVGAKKVKVLHDELGIASLGELEYACLENRLVALKGFGEKTQENILAGIRRIGAYSGRFRYPVGRAAADSVIAHLSASRLCRAIEAAGSVRRRLETVKDVDILAVSKKPEKLMEVFVAHPEVKSVTAHGTTKSAVVLESGIAVDLRVVPAESFAPALMYFTGSKDHNTVLRGIAKKQGLKLNEYGLFAGENPEPAASEEAIFRRLGLAYIPPELREDRGEIEAAAAGEVPVLVERKDLQGVLHVHTTYSDGATPLAQMARAVREMGYRYLGIADHSQSAAYARGLKPDDVRRQHEEIDRLNGELVPFRIFKGIESDILPDGSLDYDEEILARFDFVIASVHSHFRMDERAMTARIVRAVQNPFTTILGHPTGRLLLSRDGYPVDLPAVLDAAAEAGTAIELNAHPYRLDLDWRYHRRAAQLGIPIPICPDAHNLEGIADMEYGIGVARKGWLTKDDVLNCWDLPRVEAFFRRKRR